MIILLELVSVGTLSLSEFFLELFNLLLVVLLVLSDFFVVLLVDVLEFLVPSFSFLSDSSFEGLSLDIVDVLEGGEGVFALLLDLSEFEEALVLNLFKLLLQVPDLLSVPFLGFLDLLLDF